MFNLSNMLGGGKALTPKKFKQQAQSMADNFAAHIAELVEDMGYVARDFFDENFDRQGFKDEETELWTPNAPRTIRDKGHAKILKGKTAKLRTSNKMVNITSSNVHGVRVFYKAINQKGVDYAELTNFGTKGKGGKQGRPQRKFIGHSAFLVRRLRGKLVDSVKAVLTRNYTRGR